MKTEASNSQEDILSFTTINGMLENADIWQDLETKFCSTNSLYHLEYPWNGKDGNHWGLNLDPKSWIRSSEKLIDWSNHVVIAHSFGASAFVDYLLSHPESKYPKAIVLVSPFYKKDAQNLNWDNFTYYVNDYPKFVKDSLNIRLMGKKINSEVFDTMCSKVKDSHGPVGWLEFYKLYLKTPYWNLNKIKIPTLIIGGEDDYSSQKKDVEDLANGIKNCRCHIMSGVNHFPMIESPKIFNGFIQEFIQEISI